MGKTFTLITAVLMSLAALTWVASAIIVPAENGGGMTRWLVALAFAIMAVIYWRIYFKRKAAENLPGRNSDG